MFQKIMVGPFGDAFLRDVRKAKRSIFLWTVNDEESMKWSIYKGVDGVISDDPKKYLEVCESYQGEKIHLAFRSWMFIIFMNMMIPLVTVLLAYRMRSGVRHRKARNIVEGSGAQVVI
jgi:phosphatidylglycerol phospholipase C